MTRHVVHLSARMAAFGRRLCGGGVLQDVGMVRCLWCYLAADSLRRAVVHHITPPRVGTDDFVQIGFLGLLDFRW